MQSIWRKVEGEPGSHTESWPFSATPQEILIEVVGGSVSIRSKTTKDDGQTEVVERTLFASSPDDTLKLNVQIGKGT